MSNIKEVVQEDSDESENETLTPLEFAMKAAKDFMSKDGTITAQQFTHIINSLSPKDKELFATQCLEMRNDPPSPSNI